MIKKSLFLGVCLALLVALAACGSRPAATNSVAKGVEMRSAAVSVSNPDAISPDSVGDAVIAGNIFIITQDMNGKTFNFSVGDTFEIQIPNIPTEGFTWEPQDLDTTVLSQVGESIFKVDSEQAGSGGIVILEFKVVGAGTTPLHLIYVRPAINGVPSLYTNSFGVTIEAK